MSHYAPSLYTLSCQSRSSCHPFLLVFGLIYVLLFVSLILLPTCFDRADRYRRRRGPELATLGGGRKERDLENGEAGFRAVRYESTVSRGFGREREESVRVE